VISLLYLYNPGAAYLQVQRTHTRYAKKKKTLEENAMRARENGFNDNGDNINDSLVLKDLLPYTTGEYNVQMDMWRE
jgi:16S rRNA C967 or C1407 C5-methylase (RsmB/RsmF family)